MTKQVCEMQIFPANFKHKYVVDMVDREKFACQDLDGIRK